MRASTLPVPDAAPSRVRVAEAILLLLVRYPYIARGDLVPPEMTQEGMVARLGFTQGAVSKVLAQFGAGGLVEVDRRHVEHRSFRLKAYQLTPRGRLLADRLRAYSEAHPPAGKRSSFPPSESNVAPTE